MESDQKICPDPSHDDHTGIHASMLVSKFSVWAPHIYSRMAEVWLPPPGGVGKRGSQDGTFIKRRLFVLI